MDSTRGDRPTVHEVTAGMLAEHEECMQVVARVEACLDRHPDVAGAWLAGLRKELPQLARVLEKHFEEEERGPLYRVLPVARPRFADRLQKLQAEHVGIRESVSRTIARAAELNDPPLHEIRELNGQVQLVVALIRRHEAAENQILLAAHWDEVGVGD